MDPLSDIVSLLRPHSAVSKPISGRGRWGVRYAAYGAPGFALVLAGRCWLELEGEAPLALECGDFVLLPATPAFALMSAPGVACTPAVPGDAPVRHGEQEGAAEVELLGGTFSIAAVNAPQRRGQEHGHLAAAGLAAAHGLGARGAGRAGRALGGVADGRMCWRAAGRGDDRAALVGSAAGGDAALARQGSGG
ncbi:MAG TPA: cupin domain-containing protein, partial [Terricaulis sp.]|nr:cupin domain-containing protein [Terricaulis sp.]